MTTRVLRRGGFGRACMLGACLLAPQLGSGCSIYAIPASVTTREMVLPYLSRECLRAKSRGEKVVVLDAGAEPRRELRFVHSPHDARVKVMLTAPFAVADYDVETEWIDVGVRGQACSTFEVSGPRTHHIGDPVVGVARMGTRGTLSFATDALDVKSYEVERELAWALDRADPLLPKVPVGLGATWQVRAEGHRSGEIIELDVVYRLTQLAGSRVTLDVVRSVHRPAQRIRGPKGYSKQVEALTTHERGVLDFDLRHRPLPSARFWDEKGHEVMRVVVGYASE